MYLKINGCKLFFDVYGAKLNVLPDQVVEKPTLIISHTIPGKGVDFTERRFEWHGNPPGKGPTDVVPKEKQGIEALNELRTLRGLIKSEHE